jgi:hypothetical protein
MNLERKKKVDEGYRPQVVSTHDGTILARVKGRLNDNLNRRSQKRNINFLKKTFPAYVRQMHLALYGEKINAENKHTSGSPRGASPSPTTPGFWEPGCSRAETSDKSPLFRPRQPSFLATPIEYIYPPRPGLHRCSAKASTSKADRKQAADRPSYSVHTGKRPSFKCVSG